MNVERLGFESVGIDRGEVSARGGRVTITRSAIEREATMLFAVIGSSAGKSREEIMAVYPRHKAFLDPFVARGEVVGVGPFIDPAGGNMALFRTRAAAEAFVSGDPFALEGLVKEYQIKDWADQTLA